MLNPALEKHVRSRSANVPCYIRSSVSITFLRNHPISSIFLLGKQYMTRFVFIMLIGLVSLEMPLSQEPVLGVWMVKADIGGHIETQDFKVDEYGK